MFCPLTGTLIMELVRENPRADDIILSDLAYCVGKCFRRPWKFAIAGHDKLVMELSTYPSCTLHR